MLRSYADFILLDESIKLSNVRTISRKTEYSYPSFNTYYLQELSFCDISIILRNSLLFSHPFKFLKEIFYHLELLFNFMFLEKIICFTFMLTFFSIDAKK